MSDVTNSSSKEASSCELDYLKQPRRSELLLQHQQEALCKIVVSEVNFLDKWSLTFCWCRNSHGYAVMPNLSLTRSTANARWPLSMSQPTFYSTMAAETSPLLSGSADIF